MKLKVDNLTFSWEYSAEKTKTHGYGEIDIEVTKCIVNAESVVKGTKPIPIVTARIKRNIFDTNDKELARKLTLTKALDMLKGVNGLPNLRNGSIRAFRERVWDAYRTLTLKPRWESAEERKARLEENRKKKQAKIAKNEQVAGTSK